MSRIVDGQKALAYRMPMYKVMGNIPSDTERLIKKSILTGDKSNIRRITDVIQRILQTKVFDIETVFQTVSYTTDYNNTQDILNLRSRFILNVSPITNPEIIIDNRKYDLGKNNIVFINHRYSYSISEPGNVKTMLMTGMFDWDVLKHAD
jgi:hypothetical protein